MTKESTERSFEVSTIRNPLRFIRILTFFPNEPGIWLRSISHEDRRRSGKFPQNKIIPNRTKTQVTSFFSESFSVSVGNVRVARLFCDFVASIMSRCIHWRVTSLLLYYITRDWGRRSCGGDWSDFIWFYYAHDVLLLGAFLWWQIAILCHGDILISRTDAVWKTDNATRRRCLWNYFRFMRRRSRY